MQDDYCVRDIYDKMGDDLSKDIFINRLLFSITGEKKYIDNIIHGTSLFKGIMKILLNDRNNKYIMSAGYWGENFYRAFSDISFNGFIDNYKTGLFEGLPVINENEFIEKYDGESIYIISIKWHKEFYNRLINKGIEKEKIIDITNILLKVFHQEQYFDLPELDRNKREVFVDCGCFDAENSVMFKKWSKDSNKKIYAFEPDRDNFLKCQLKLGNEEAVLIEKGVWSSDTILKFDSKSNEASKVSEEGNQEVIVTSIDNSVQETVTFIKMDIEGAELEALKGAEKHIKIDKPKLAISIYHKREDIWKIPKLILSYNFNYKFYLRHYSFGIEETVLYAIMDE